MNRSTAIGLTLILLLGAFAPAAAQQVVSGDGYVTGKDVAQSLVYIDREPYRVTPSTKMRSDITGRSVTLTQIEAPRPDSPIAPLIYAEFNARVSDDVRTLVSLTLLEPRD